MADNEIRVVITGVASDLRAALDGAKGDLGGLKTAIKDVPNKVKIDIQAQTADATERLRLLKDAARDVPNRIHIDADVDDGVAKAKLALLNRQIKDTETSLAKTALGIASDVPGGGGGGAGSSALSAVPGGAAAGAPAVGMAQALAAGAPIIAALAGSLTAIVGSLGAATLGMAALGTAAVGVGAAGLGPLVLLSGGLKDAVALSGKLDTAQTNLAASQKQYGDNSKQAATAQAALNKIVDGANPAVLSFAKAWGQVSDTLDKAEQAVLPAFASALKPVLSTFTGLLPTIEQMAKIDLRGLAAGFKPLLDFASSSAFKSALVDLADVFGKLAGPIGQGVTNIIRALLNVAMAAAPFLIQIADAFRAWSASFADSLTPGQHLTDLISGLVGQLKSWWDLAKSIGGLMVTIFSAGAGTGQTLVNLLTGVVKQWNAWLNTKAGQDAMKTFFTDSKNLVVALFNALAPLAAAIGKLVIDLMPAFTAVIKVLTPAIKGVSDVIGVIADVLGSDLVQAIATVLVKFNPLVLVFSHLPQIFGLVKAGIGDLGGVWSTVWGAITTAFKAALNFILGGISTILGGMASIVNAANGIPIIGSIFKSAIGGDAVNALHSGQTAIDNYRKTLQPTADVASTTTKAMATNWGSLATSTTNSTGKIRTQFGLTNDALKGIGAQWKSTFDGINATTGNVMKQVLATLKTDIGLINENLGTGTNKGAAAFSATITGAYQTVLSNTSLTAKGVQQGLAQIQKMLDGALKAVGAGKINLGDFASLPASEQQGLLTGNLTAGGVESPHAGGGIVQIGRPGQKGRDTVPLSVGGTDIAVGSGEKVAVFNNEQQKVADHFMAPVGGLGGMFKRFKKPHYMDGGGFVPAFSQAAGGGGGGGFVADPGTQQTEGELPQLTSRLNALAHALGVTIYGISGYRSPAHSVAVGGFADDPHTQGKAEDIGVNSQLRSSAAQISEAQLAKFGLYRPFDPGDDPNNSEVNHIQILGSAVGAAITSSLGGQGAVGAVAGGAGIAATPWSNIKAPKWTGPGGAGGAIGQGALAKVVTAANKFGQTQAGSAAAGGGGGSTAGLSGNLRAIVGQLSQRFGWTGQISDWLQVINQESGGSMTAKNPSSGAYGIAQFIDGPSEYASYGGNVNTMAGQLLAMANYIKGRYGGPASAEAHERAFNWYSGGGWITTGATEDDFSGGPMQTGYPTSYNGGITFAQLLMGGANAGKHPNLSDLLGLGGGILPAGFPIDLKFGGKELDDVRRIDTGSGALDGDTHWTIDIEQPAAQRLGFPGKGDVEVRAHGAGGATAGGKGAPPGAKGPKSTGNKVTAGGFGKAPKPSKLKLPAVKPLAGFDPSDMGSLTAIDNYLQNQLSPWQAYIQGLHGRQAPVPLVTMPDGSQVVNWDGMTDPVTGAFDKGINARLAEIGHLGGSNPDINTELGIEQQFLNKYYAEAATAAHAQSVFGPWLKGMQADHAKQQAAEADDQALVDRVTLLKERLPQEKTDRTAALTKRFALAKHKIQVSGAKSTFSASTLLTDQLSGLTSEEAKARAGIPSAKPDGWKGSAAAWTAQRKSELADITSEFSDRRDALHSSAATHKFSGTLAKSNALFGLGQEESAEKLSLSDAFSAQSVGYTDQLRSTRTLLARAKTLVSADETSLTNATGSKDGRTIVAGGGSFEDTLKGLLSPMGPLQLNIAQTQNIDIPNLTDEIQSLTGTKPPAAAAGSSATDLSALLSLVSQQLTNTQQALAVSQANTGALAGFAPLLTGRLVGSFQSGIDFVPQTGLALVHKGEQITPDPGGPQGNRASATVQTGSGPPVQIEIVMGNDDQPLMKVISAAVNSQALPVVSSQSGRKARLMAGVRRP